MRLYGRDDFDDETLRHCRFFELKPLVLLISRRSLWLWERKRGPRKNSNDRESKIIRKREAQRGGEKLTKRKNYRKNDDKTYTWAYSSVTALKSFSNLLWRKKHNQSPNLLITYLLVIEKKKTTSPNPVHLLLTSLRNGENTLHLQIMYIFCLPLCNAENTLHLKILFIFCLLLLVMEKTHFHLQIPYIFCLHLLLTPL